MKKNAVAKRIFTLALAMTMLAAVLASFTGCGLGQEAQGLWQSQPGSSGQEQGAYRVGDRLQADDMDILYTASGEYQDNTGFFQPEEGNKFIFLEFVVKNISQEVSVGVSSFEFNCYADGKQADIAFVGQRDISASLSPGRKTYGKVFFEIPKDAKSVKVDYYPNIFLDEKVTFLYEGTRDCGYVYVPQAEKSPEALQVGQADQHDGLKMTFLDCFVDETEYLGEEAREGYHFVTCKFEAENLGAEELQVSWMGFHGYAEGQSCACCYFRDGMLEGTLAPGEKTQGSITFEMPVGAQAAEVEYKHDDWSSYRMVFDAGVV